MERRCFGIFLFDIKKGEVFGIAGVSGNGQEEIVRSRLRFIESDTGNTRAQWGRYYEIKYPGAYRKGIGYVPVDRHRDGMVMSMTLAENMMLKTSYDKKWLRSWIG